ARTNDQPRVCRIDGAQHERPPVLEPEHAIRLERIYAPSKPGKASAQIGSLHGEHRIADRAPLPLGMDAIRIADVVADGSLEPIVAVETAAILPELDEPWPDRRRTRIDGDRVIDAIRRRGGVQLVAGEGRHSFLGGASPLQR